MDACEWCGKPCPAWSAMCEACAAPLGGLPWKLAPKEKDAMALTDIDIKEVGRSIQLAGAIYVDSEDVYLVTLPDALTWDQGVALSNIESRAGGSGLSVDVTSVKLTAEEWETFLRQTDLVEVEALVKDPATGKTGKAIVRKSNRQVSQHFSWVVFRRDEFRCRYCGADEVPLTVDHLITWESGGPSTPDNLVASCRKCNGARGETPYAEWLMSKFYRQASQRLSHEDRFANQALVATLADVKVVPLKPGKKKRSR